MTCTSNSSVRLTISNTTISDVPDRIPPALADHLGPLLGRAHEAHRRLSLAALAPLELTPKGFGALRVLDAEGPMSQRALGRLLRIDKSPMVGLIDDLERMGLAERRRGRSDRRVQDIHLTAKGSRVLQRVTRLADESNERTFAALDDDERTVLHDLLLRVAEAHR